MITFYFTQKGIGGVQNLFLNITKELFKRKIQVKFIYYRDTWLTKELDKEGVEYQLFDLEEDKRELIFEFINKDDVIVTTLNEIIIREIYQIKPFFLAWIVHPKTFDGKRYSLIDSIKRIFIKPMIEQMILSGGFYYMDKSCSDSTNMYFDISASNEYLPIPVMGIEKRNSTVLKSLIEKRNQDIIPLSYIGRAANWKVNPVKKIISDLSEIKIKSKKDFRLHVFTDDVEEFKKLLSNDSDKIEIVYHENIFGLELDHFIKNEIFINLAMGTSALESAKLGIPSILLDASYGEFPHNYKYNWVYSTESFSLGKVIDKDYIPTNGYTLDEIFKHVFEDESFICDISNRCLEYTELNHNIETVASLFLEKANHCTNKITPSIRKSFFDFLFFK